MSPGLDFKAFRNTKERKPIKNMNSYVTISSPRTASCALFARCESTQLSLHLREGQILFASIASQPWLWRHFKRRAMLACESIEDIPQEDKNVNWLLMITFPTIIICDCWKRSENNQSTVYTQPSQLSLIMKHFARRLCKSCLAEGF